VPNCAAAVRTVARVSIMYRDGWEARALKSAIRQLVSMLCADG